MIQSITPDYSKSIKIIPIILILMLLVFKAQAHVNLKNPVGGETFHEGETITISWEIQISHDQENWDLLYSTDGGSTWIILKENMPVEQLTYEWVIPAVETNEARIKIIQDNSGYDYTDESGNFIITTNISEGAMLTIGTNQVIFDNLEPGSEDTQTIQMTNTGTEDLTISSFSGLSAPFTINHPALPLVIPAAGEQYIDITFSPSQSGEFTGALQIATNTSQGTIEIPISGNSFILTRGEPNICYAVTGIKDGGRLLQVDLSSGASTLISNLETIDLSTAIAGDGALNLFIFEPENHILRKVDARDGRTVKIMDLDLNFVAMDFGFDGMLYIVGEDKDGNRDLYRLHIQTRDFQKIGPVAVRLTGIAHNPTDDGLYGISSSGTLFLLETDDGSMVNIGTGTSTNVTDIAFDSNGKLYAVAGGGKSADNELLEINKSDGSVITTIGNTGFTAISGLTISPDVITATEPLINTLRVEVYPNPFSEELHLKFIYEIPSSIAIYSITGKHISTLYPKSNKVSWKGKDKENNPVPNGVYILKVRINDKLIGYRVLLER